MSTNLLKWNRKGVNNGKAITASTNTYQILAYNLDGDLKTLMSMFKLTFVESWLVTADSSSSSQRRVVRVEPLLYKNFFKHEYYTLDDNITL